MSDKPPSIQFMDGCFDDLCSEEADRIRREIEEEFLSGELLENSLPVDMDQLAEDEPELYRYLLDQLSKITPPTAH